MIWSKALFNASILQKNEGSNFSRQFRPKSRPRHSTCGCFAHQRFILETSQMTMPITPQTSSTPNHTPALQMSPISSQPLSDTAEKSRHTDKNHACFIDAYSIPI